MGRFHGHPSVALPGATVAATDTALLPRNPSSWSMFHQRRYRGVVVQAVMIGLALASLATRTVGLAKTIEVGRARMAPTGGTGL